MSINAYKRTIRESESPRQIEARVFARVTGALQTHREAYEAAESNEARNTVLADGLRDALADNRRLWITLRDDLADSGNTFPPALRAQLISIALWVDRQSQQVLGGGAGLRALIDVNSSILAGLSSRPALAAVSDHGTQSHAETL
ncbi:flagellar biosynthesis regulator FlaF [Salipiger sp. P9]|uniref:flagellar biosynthesis regulator FlaF n=1 Tax=Salipiger pentaromativorans TaxID=2943193 RepID=UPI00215852EB|nr:flagellar biosynthesis regulator FlaF [Salipiger pentaromativorans]MCR8550505.1 flagellar biosynthesis regulator FlaF [Salipiger pentaromativorans]